MSKSLHIHVIIPVPVDTFEQTRYLGKIDPLQDQFKAALVQIGGDGVKYQAKVMRDVVRKKAVEGVGTDVSEASTPPAAPIDDADPQDDAEAPVSDDDADVHSKIASAHRRFNAA